LVNPLWDSLRNLANAKSYGALVAVQILFGSWPIIGKLALQSIPSSGLVAFRTAGAAIFFTLFSLFTKRLRKPSLTDFLKLVVFSLLGVGVNQLLFVKGLSLTTAINTVLLGVSIPVFAIAISLLLGFDRLTIGGFSGVVLAIGGIVFLLWPELGHGSGTGIGNLLILLSSLCYGAYIAFSKRDIERLGALNAITWIFIIAALVTVPIGSRSLLGNPIRISTGLVIAVVYIILMPTVLAYYLNAWVLVRVSPSTVAIFIYLQPLVAFCAAPIILGERVEARALIASVMVIAGVVLATTRMKRGDEIAVHVST
jgi:drug/metabolite transporter (DMT)-like permease